MSKFLVCPSVLRYSTPSHAVRRAEERLKAESNSRKLPRKLPGHPIIFLSSLNFVTRVHRALSALRKRFFERRVSHLIRTLHLIVTDIRRTFFSVAHHPLSRLQKFSERGPEYCPPRGPLASTLLIGVLSLAYRTARSIHLRAGSAVSQHGILHAEGSFWS